MANAKRAKQRSEAEWTKPRRGGEPLRDTPHRRRVEVVIVIVREQNEIDLGQLLEGYAGRHQSSRSDPRDRRCALAPDRIGQNIERPELEQHRRMPDPGYRPIAARGAGSDDHRRSRRQGSTWRTRWNRLTTTVPQPPAQKIGEAMKLGAGPRVLEPAARPVMRERGWGRRRGRGRNQSARMAMTGSTRAARRAGR